MPHPAPHTIENLFDAIGTPAAPQIIDLRLDEDFAADPTLIPGARRLPYAALDNWVDKLDARPVTLVCHRGAKISQGVAALLRHRGHCAQALVGGHVAWRSAQLPAVEASAVAAFNTGDASVWVTRKRPKIDRIACPWLIRRFADPRAVFLFVDPAEVAAVAERFGAIPFDVEGVFWSHRGERCTFDTMLEEFGLKSESLGRLADIVRGADTARPDLAPQAAGLLAVSLGLSQMFDDDLAQLEAGMLVYDAIYRWCRDAVHETHNWPKAQGGQR